jgi:hypothetical protein
MIDVDVFYKLSRIVFPPNADIYTIGFSTHKLKPLLSSSVFSSPACLLQADCGGSIGYELSDVQSWGTFVGNVTRTIETRTFYRKLYCSCPICNDPQMKLRWLWGQYRAHGVKAPVVHHIYLKRAYRSHETEVPVHMLWRYQYLPTRHIAGVQRLKEWSIDEDFERSFTFDIIAANRIPLDIADLRDSVRLAHDLNFLYNEVRRALLTAHGQPSPIVRREWVEVPRVIVKAVPISQWTTPVLPP